MYKNVTLNTRKMAIPAARRAADDAIIMAYINTQRPSVRPSVRVFLLCLFNSLTFELGFLCAYACGIENQGHGQDKKLGLGIRLTAVILRVHCHVVVLRASTWMRAA